MFPQLVKIPLLIFGAYFHHRSLTSPTPKPDKNESARFTVPDARFIKSGLRWAVTPVKVFVWAAALCESAVILDRTYSTYPYSIRLLSFLTSITAGSVSSVSNVRITPDFLFGWTFLVIGTLIRIACYRYLGRFFTYELAIRDGHQLVTSGPYTIVRHPSYSGIVMVFIGTAQLVIGRGSLLAESTALWYSISGRIIGFTLLAYWVCYCGAVAVRASREDMMMKKEFGKQWSEWARRTPFKMFPGVY